nr:MAG TPA: hypothetical protein [Caudoviricetes sp.]
MFYISQIVSMMPNSSNQEYSYKLFDFHQLIN